jgi:hypothetical protein
MERERARAREGGEGESARAYVFVFGVCACSHWYLPPPRNHSDFENWRKHELTDEFCSISTERLRKDSFRVVTCTDRWPHSKSVCVGGCVCVCVGVWCGCGSVSVSEVLESA